MPWTQLGREQDNCYEIMTRKPKDHLKEILVKIPTTSRRAEGNEKRGVPGLLYNIIYIPYKFFNTEQS